MSKPKTPVETDESLDIDSADRAREPTNVDIPDRAHVTPGHLSTEHPKVETSPRRYDNASTVAQNTATETTPEVAAAIEAEDEDRRRKGLKPYTVSERANLEAARASVADKDVNDTNAVRTDRQDRAERNAREDGRTVLAKDLA